MLPHDYCDHHDGDRAMGMSLNQILHRFVWNGLALAAIAAPLAIASVHWPMKMVLAGLAGALLLAYSLLSFRRRFRIRFDGFVLYGLALVAFMLMQLMPLSDNLLESLSPLAFEGVQRARDLGYQVVGRISLEPAETGGLICLVGTALCLYVVAFNLSYREGTGNKILAMVGIAGAVVAAVTFIHFATGSKLLLGFYSPRQGLGRVQLFFSSFVNNNNSAGFLNLSLFILAGQWQKAQFGKIKGIYGILVLMTAAASVMMLSRGGLLALVMGGIFLAAITRWNGGRSRSSSYAVAAVGIFVTIISVGLFLLLFNKVLGQIENTRLFPFGESDGKMLIWEKARHAADSFAKVGAGGGAFRTAFSPFNDLVAQGTIPHAESELVQPFLEFGRYVGFLTLFVPVLLVWRRFAFARADGFYAGALAGLFALGIQQVGDFGLRIPGVLLPAAITLGALSGGWVRQRGKVRTWNLRLAGIKMIPLAGTAYLLLVVGSSWAASNGAEVVHETLSQQLQGASVGPVEAERELGERALQYNTHDSLVYTLLGRRRVERNELDLAQAHFDRAMALCPLCVAPRVAQIKLTEKRGDVEAMLQILKEVAQLSPGHRATVFKIVVDRKLSAKLVVDAWQDDPELLFRLVQHLYVSSRHGMAEELIKTSTGTLGYDVRMLNYLGMIYLAAKEYDAADQVATYLMGMFPDDRHGFVIQARVFIRRNMLEEALLMYEEALDSEDAHADVQLSLEVMGLLARMRRWDRFEAIASDLRLTIGEDARRQSSFHLLMAIREEMRGEYFTALQELEQAESSTPYNVLVPLRKAKLQLLLGRPDKAVAEYRKALKINPRNVEAAEGLKNLESVQNPEASL